MRALTTWSLLVAAFLMITIFVGCPQVGQRIGNATCLACHNGVSGPDMREFNEGLHASIDCEDCHGPGFAHFRAGGRNGVLIGNPGNDPYGATVRTCAKCHPDEAAGHGDTKHFTERRASCNTCHDVHKRGAMTVESENDTLLAQGQYAELCGRCHDRQVNEFEQSGHKIVDVITCGACHNLHMPSALASNPLDNTMCLQCHASFELGFTSPEVVDFHTGQFHPLDPAGSGASRCTGCHMQPIHLQNQEDGPHNHLLMPRPPSETISEIESGARVHPNSCAGVAGCHDADVPGSGYPYDVNSIDDNEILQGFYDVIGEI